MADVRKLLGDLSHVVILLVMIFIVLFLLTWVGLVKCAWIPFWCNTYWGILGGPKVLIVYGDSGLGNPIGGCDEDGCSLQWLLENPEVIGVHAQSMHIDRVTSGGLRPYHMVIVEKARKIPTKTLQAFMEYVNYGGRLVWTGDAGTELAEGDEYLYLDERDKDTNKHKIIGPWSRKSGDTIVAFDQQILSLNYVGNYCDMMRCLDDRPTFAGELQPEPSREHPLVQGMKPALQLWIFNGRDFGIVETVPSNITNEVLTINFSNSLIVPDTNGFLADFRKKNLGTRQPMVITSGPFERVIYYAMPPELFADSKLSKFGKGGYLLPLQNLYYGAMLG